jgi:soluble lytic murein transglycosylase-like protein
MTSFFGSRGGEGCFSAFAIPPLAVLFVGALLAAASFANPLAQARASDGTGASSGISSLFTPEVAYWSSSIVRWASDQSLDPNLVAVVMQIESCGDPFARSATGAIGLFQVMLTHFAPGEDPFSPETNAYRGLLYLKRSLATASADSRLALAGYNGGIGVIAKSEWSWPPETRRYAHWGSGIYSDAMSGTLRSGRLAEWIAAGGDALCRQARRRLNIGP